MAVGAHCERLWREAEEQAATQALAASHRAYDVAVAKAREVPIDQRARWHDTEEGAEHRDDIDFALQTDQGLPDDQEPARVVTITPKQLKGPNAPGRAIIERVAAEETRRRGIDISPRRVAACLKEFRRIQKRLEADPADDKV